MTMVEQGTLILSHPNGVACNAMTMHLQARLHKKRPSSCTLTLTLRSNQKTVVIEPRLPKTRHHGNTFLVNEREYPPVAPFLIQALQDRTAPLRLELKADPDCWCHYEGAYYRRQSATSLAHVTVGSVGGCKAVSHLQLKYIAMFKFFWDTAFTAAGPATQVYRVLPHAYRVLRPTSTGFCRTPTGSCDVWLQGSAARLQGLATFGYRVLPHAYRVLRPTSTGFCRTPTGSCYPRLQGSAARLQGLATFGYRVLAHAYRVLRHLFTGFCRTATGSCDQRLQGSAARLQGPVTHVYRVLPHAYRGPATHVYRVLPHAYRVLRPTSTGFCRTPTGSCDQRLQGSAARLQGPATQVYRVLPHAYRVL
ncbi:hypothetical protein V8C86DRAFT_2440213 [Haematococcus lacustris]